MYAAITGIDAMRGMAPEKLLIEGEARGADLLMREFCEQLSWEIDPHEPAWHRYGRGAGGIRNGEMLRAWERHDAIKEIHAFHPDIRLSRGTANMAGQILVAGHEFTLWDESGEPQVVDRSTELGAWLLDRYL